MRIKPLFIYFAICFQFCFLNQLFFECISSQYYFFTTDIDTSAFISLSICRLVLQLPGGHWKELRPVIFLIRFAFLLTDRSYYQPGERNKKHWRMRLLPGKAAAEQLAGKPGFITWSTSLSQNLTEA